MLESLRKILTITNLEFPCNAESTVETPINASNSDNPQEKSDQEELTFYVLICNKPFIE